MVLSNGRNKYYNNKADSLLKKLDDCKNIFSSVSSTNSLEVSNKKYTEGNELIDEIVSEISITRSQFANNIKNSNLPNENKLKPSILFYSII